LSCMNKTSRIVLLYMFVFFSALYVFAALNICKKCGYENEERVPKCTHCSADLPVPPEVKEVERQDNDLEEDIDYLSVDIVSAEVHEGRKYQAKKSHELARLFFRNALAVEGLTDPIDGSKRSEKLLKLIRESERASRTITKTCRRCNGGGRASIKLGVLDGANRPMAERSFGKNSPIKTTSSQKCKKCNGLGNVRASGSISDLKYQAGKATSVFRELQQSRKYEPIGNAWVPKHVADKLDIRARATLMRAVASPCPTCSGLGRLDCRTCKGVGRLDCGNRGCVKGRVEVDDSDKRTRRLSGAMTKQCGECRGRGSQECRACAEEGTILCSKCDGSGESELCDKCSGRGYLECSKCRGRTGPGVVCKYCVGEKVVLCKSCKGAGRD
jgi:hypothetical protein